MVQVANWIKEMFFIILSLTFLEIMLPEGNLAAYVKYIFGLVVLAVILSPLNLFLHKF